MKQNNLSLADRLGQFCSSAAYDMLRVIGYPDQRLSSQIRPHDIASNLSGKTYAEGG